MNRVDFMKQLESLLQNISPAEREEALQYYNEYFNDAGEENEQNVIEALGNPAKVAENIKKDLYGSGYGDNMYQRTPVGDRALTEYRGVRDKEMKKENHLSTGVIVLIVILGVLASPVLLGLGLGVLGVLFGVLMCWLALIVTFGMLAVSLLLLMVVCAVVGIMCVAQAPFVGMGVAGLGMLCGGIGILFLMLTVAMAGIATPAIFRGVIGLCRKQTHKKEKA